MAEAFAGLTEFCHIVDAIVIYDSDITQHVKHVKEFLQRCSEKKILLNLDTVPLNYNFIFTRVNTRGATQYLHVNSQNLPWNLYFHET